MNKWKHVPYSSIERINIKTFQMSLNLLINLTQSQLSQFVQVLVFCCNKIPEIRWFMKNRNLFLIVLEDGKFKKKALANQVSREGPFPRWPSFPHVLTWWKGQRIFLMSFFITAFILFMRALPLTKSSPKGPAS